MKEIQKVYLKNSRMSSSENNIAAVSYTHLTLPTN